MNAVIYCRVSSKEQVEGTSLESQELACHNYAKTHKLTVSRVFVEEGESAKFADRPQLLEILDYCKDKSRAIEVLIVWKLDRFARNVEDHYAIKSALKRLGVSVVSVTEPIQADANGKLMETILAGFAQFDNDVRAMRTIQGMQQRIRDGVWPWEPPLGYLSPVRPGKKTKADEPHPGVFELLQKAWTMFATGGYTKADIVRVLREWGVHGKQNRLVGPQFVDYMFANEFYAGVLRDPWTGQDYKGGHKAMVTAAEFARVQTIIAVRRNSEPQSRPSDDFPLRGSVRCPSCEALMTGYVAQGRSRGYPYYKCFRPECPTRTRSYSAAAVHDEFTRFLHELSVVPEFTESIVTELIASYWDEQSEVRRIAASKRAAVQQVKQQLQELLSMRTARLIADDEFVLQRDALRTRIHVIESAALGEGEASLTVTETTALAHSLADLTGIWSASPLSAKRRLASTALPVGYAFQRIESAEVGLLFGTFSLPAGGKSTSSIEPKEVGSSYTGQGVYHKGSEFRTTSNPGMTSVTGAFRGAGSNWAAPTKPPSNAIFAEIRKFLQLVRPTPPAKKKAA
jgi:site-specific DNA recombinase